MGVIKITPRSSSLQSAHSVGAGSVHIPHMPTNIDTGEIQKWKGVGNFGQGVADFGEKMLKAVGVFAEIKNETQLDEFETDFLSRLHAANMNPDTGFMTRRLGTTADVETLAKEGPQTYKEIFDEVAEAHGMTGVRRNWAMNRVGRTIESANYRLASRVSSAYQQLNLSQAAANVEARHTVWNDGMDDQAATEELLDAGRKLLYAQGYDDSAVELKFGEQVENLAEEYATRRFSELPDEAAVDVELKKLEANPAGVLSGNKALADQFSTQHPFSQNVADRLKGRLERRRREIQVRDQQIVDQAANVGIAAVAQIRDKDGNYPTERLAMVEASIGSLQRIQANLPKESNAAMRAATHISELDSKADMIAQQEMIDEYLNELKTNPKAKIYAPETINEKGEVSPARNAYIGSGRKERLAPMVQQHFDVQRMKERHPQEVAALRSQMLAATASPGSFVGKCDQSLMDGRISLLERNELVEDFMKDWTTNGKPQLAHDILFSIQAAFPDSPISASFEWSAKESAMVPVKKPELENVEYRRMPYGDEKSSSFFNAFMPLQSYVADHTTRGESLSIKQIADLVRVAGNLGVYDGKVIDYDPILGGSKDGKDFFGDEIKKDHPFSARAYFNKYLSRLKDVKKAEKAGDFIERWINAEANMREIELQRQEKAGIR